MKRRYILINGKGWDLIWYTSVVFSCEDCRWERTSKKWY